ncbi:MAG: pyridoxine 5'-phosphate synthase [Ignavibacteriae bacterium]|nr:pyridoxine 5'-phosphate synthase [Ignavibacteriota bacterium]
MRLCINIDHIATLREARGGLEPDPVTAAHVCELAGADGIVCHLREDRRHINDRDLRILRETVKTKLDLEMAATDEIVKIAIETLPELVTFVPERRQELTTEGGLDVLGHMHHLRAVIAEMHRHDIEVSLFIDPVLEQVDAAAECEADKIEIHTGEYANARTEHEQLELLEVVRTAARRAKELGMGVNAGHGLNYLNMIPFRSVTEIDEVSIGHSIISRAVFVGLDRAVREMIALTR